MFTLLPYSDATQMETEQMITDAQKAAIQASMDRLSGDPMELMECFYDRLFEISPESEALFKGDMRAQYEKLLDMLMLVLHSIDNLNQLVVVVVDLGARHVTYGVTTAHYDAVAQALIHALSQKIDGWSAEEQQAWGTLYGYLSDLMMTGGANYLEKAG